ncbi:right-handed parallel beta-helix repeat-containing protein [Nocardioides campestrisoli]|uniref:right-handed parallel beta-helix repeat-containing protein n=1 Tax=Nocardioides campestrisoli TaxID=2736757 RepID=UPI0015E6C6E6|nr:right-handed parallel beta-helix repeat-containing protein [Nocardioides campestrisoli]
MPTRRQCGIVLSLLALTLLVITLSACTGGGPAPSRSTPEPPAGVAYDVTELGADPEPGTGDDAPAIREALAAAEAGDEVVLPAGVYDLHSAHPDDEDANLLLADGVRLRGAGDDATVLRTSFDGEDDSAVVRGLGVEDSTVSDLAITSGHAGGLGSDPEEEGPGGGPAYGVQIGEDDGEGSRGALVEDVSVERFQRHGITVKASREVTVTGCRVADATSVGPGGSGYGIAVEGPADQRDPEADDDSRDNVVVGNHLDGTHLRHGILLQFATHDNLVADNTITGGVLDAIDLHGEGEYDNEIRGNTITEVGAAAIALGNPGGTKHEHDASGEGNWVHDNRLVGNEQGVVVVLGTPETLVEDNEIVGERGSVAGVELRHAPGTVVRDNTITGDGVGDGFWAVVLAEDGGTDGRGAGIPTDVVVTGNRITGDGNGIDVHAGRGLDVAGNTIDVEGTPWRVAAGSEVEEGGQLSGSGRPG